MQRWDDGSGRITVIRSKTDVEAQGAVVAITPAAMKALEAIRPAGVGGDAKVFGLSESQIARRVKAVARAAGLADWEFFSGHSGRVGMARRMAHNLARWTTRIGLGEPVLTTKTLRRRFLSLAGRLTRKARRLTLHLPHSWPWQNQFSSALARLRALPLPS